MSKKKTANNYLIIGLIILIAAIPRFILININEAVWWDEAQYLLMTKSLLTGSQTTGWWEGRSITYPLMLASLSLLTGFNELWIRAINLLFSLGVVLMTYFLTKELYNEKYAIFASIITSTQWVLFFYSFRVLLDIPSTFFILASAYYFIKSQNKNSKLNLLSGILIGIAFSIRFTSSMIAIVYLAYLLLSKNHKIKNYYWIMGFIISFLPLGVYDLIVYGNPVHSTASFLSFNLQTTGGALQGDAFYYLTSMPSNYGIALTVMLVLGLIGLIFTTKNKSNLFVLLNIILILPAYSIMTQVKEIRFLIHLLPFISMAGILGMVLLYNSLTKNKKWLVAFMILIIGVIILENSITGYSRVFQSSTSYNLVRYAGEFLSTQPGSTILSASVPQISYYSGKETYAFPENETSMNELIIEKDIDYVTVSIFEQHPDYSYNLNLTNFVPIQAYPEPSQAYLIVYAVNKTSSLS